MPRVTTPTQSESTNIAREDMPPRRSTVIVGILAVVLLFAAILALLLYRAMFNPVPSRTLIIRADKMWEGVVVRVEGVGSHAPLSSDIQAAGSFIVPFFLTPGTYTVHVMRDGNEVLSKEIDLTDEPSVDIDLTAGATTRPTPPKVAE
jgi:hypothetical protein